MKSWGAMQNHTRYLRTTIVATCKRHRLDMKSRGVEHKRLRFTPTTAAAALNRGGLA